MYEKQEKHYHRNEGARERRKSVSSYNTVSKNTPVYEGQQIREMTPLSINTVIQKKGTAEYLNVLPSNQARHHIIPDSVLKAFIGKVRTKNENIFIDLVNAVELSYINYHHISAAEIEEVSLLDGVPAWRDRWCLQQEILAGSKVIPTTREKFLMLITYTKIEDRDSYNEDMQSAFVWSPGNLVIGPKERKGDPGSAFDSEAAVKGGIAVGNPVSIGVAATGQNALTNAMAMMEAYVKGTVELDEAMVRDVIIPHIRRPITDAAAAEWE